MRILISIAILFILYACGSGSMRIADAADLALNTVTDSAQPTYELAKAFCSSREWEIVYSDRTPAQKEAAIHKIRNRCDEIFDIFETIIRRQKDVRRIVDASRNGSADAIQALNQVREIQSLFGEACKKFETLKGE